jgi:beta-glucosidase
MRNRTLFFLACLFAAVMSSYADQPSKPKSAVLDEQVAALLSKMTIEEKVGQMTQVTIDVVANNHRAPGGWHSLDADKLRTAIVKYNVGSILNVAGSAYSLENWHEVITQIQDVAMKETRLKIPVIYGIDAVHGANYTIGATIFPQNLAMAATWNPGLMKKNGEITALEVRASGIPWNFNPVLDIGRQPLWPRLFETFGEDPYLASAMGATYVKGSEGENNELDHKEKIAVCLKHYIGYSFPLTGKDRTPAYIPEILLREKFLPTFKAAVDAGAHTVMVNSSEINGVPVHASHYYLTELLRGELGFKGFVVSDWADIINLYTREKVAATPKDAVRQAVMAGVDMSMVPLDFSFYENLVELVRDGSVPMSRLDEAVSRILRVKLELGLFGSAYPDKTLKEKFASQESHGIALQSARESIILLKNEGNLLPLAKNKKILVTGPTATMLTALNGGWTITWQGNDESLYPKNKDNVLQAIEKKFGKANVSYVPGAKIAEEIDIAAAARAAAQADVVVLCLGEDAYCETPGNISDLALPGAQVNLVKAIHATGKPMVMVLVEGRPRIIREIVDKAPAIVAAFLPGMEGGTALAEVLAGDVNPSGKLPITYPKYPNDLTLYDHKFSEHSSPFQAYNPQFPFGHGLSYTNFSYSDLTLQKAKIKLGESLNVEVTLKNTGSRPGQEVVQLYLTDLVASVTPSMKRLKGFQKIELAPGESKRVSLTLKQDDLSFIGRDNKPVVEPGEFKVAIANLSQTFVLE